MSGRFLQTDPVGYGPDVNWYAYVGNDPVNKGDPTGQCNPHGGGCSDFSGGEGNVASGSQLDDSVGGGGAAGSVNAVNTPGLDPKASGEKESKGGKGEAMAKGLDTADKAASITGAMSHGAGMVSHDVPGLSELAAITGATNDISKGTPADEAILNHGTSLAAGIVLVPIAVTGAVAGVSAIPGAGESGVAQIAAGGFAAASAGYAADKIGEGAAFLYKSSKQMVQDPAIQSMVKMFNSIPFMICVTCVLNGP